MTKRCDGKERDKIKYIKKYVREENADAEKKYTVGGIIERSGDDDGFKEEIFEMFREIEKESIGISASQEERLSGIKRDIKNNIKRSVNPSYMNVVEWYMKVAAFVLCPLLICLSLYFSVNNGVDNATMCSLHAPNGARISFTLPDGSTGWLNGGSMLEYPTDFRKKRELKLYGEAWFDVVHDVNSPFEVWLEESKIKVLGTKFNVLFQPKIDHSEVVLEEGSIMFYHKGVSDGLKMMPNEKIVFNNDNVKKEKTDATKYSAWKDGSLIFKSDRMSRVVDCIERFYGVEIEIIDEEIHDYIIRGTFKNASLNDVLHCLTLTSPISYDIVERDLKADGHLTKRKVKIALSDK